MKRLSPRAIVCGAILGSVAAVLAVQSGGCAQTPIPVPVRSLERSGKVSFVCLGDPADAPAIEHDLSDCSLQQFTAINDYFFTDDAGDIDAGSGKIPHLYALVTQTTRGEVAVIDTSTEVGNVLDENPREPGANFLPVGANPTSIVSTPGGVATFVGVSEIGRAGLFALPSSQIRPAAATSTDSGLPPDGSVDQPVSALTSWPACSLPAAPGDILIVNDPRDASNQERVSCDSPYTPVPVGDRISAVEQRGRQKLVVAMPDLGGIIVVDANELLDRQVGTFAACKVERWLPLDADLGGIASPPLPPTGPACAFAKPSTPPLQTCSSTADCQAGFTCKQGVCANVSRPSGLSYADGKLYVGDLQVPVIHVIDMPTPCEPAERAPLLPTSAEDPSRVVYAPRVAVAPAPTPDLKRYLYATDVDDASVMVFDVGPSSTSRRPLVRQHPEWNPFQPRDRVKFVAPPADVIVVQRDVPQVDPTTGIAVSGVRCDPDPNLVVCTNTSTSCDIAANFRNSADFSTGAGPTKLRGEFAFVALTSGKVAVIDVDDFDAPCRAPQSFTKLSGCGTDNVSGLDSTGEFSCNVVQANAPRATNYEVISAQIGDHVPGIQSAPQLYKFDGTVVDFTSGPVMQATVGPATPKVSCIDSTDVLKCGGRACVNGACVPGIYEEGGQLLDVPTAASTHTLMMNLEDPRAQISDQNWAVTFEGAIPGFDQRIASLEGTSVGTPGVDRVSDSSSRFCSAGVLSEKAMRELLAAQGLSQAEIDARAPGLADYVQITNEVPDINDGHWLQLDGGANASNPENNCTYQGCLDTYGPVETPTFLRDLRILEAYQDHVEIEPRSLPCGAESSPCSVGGNKGTCQKDENGKIGCFTQCGVDQKTNKYTCTPPAPQLPDIKCCFPSALTFTVRGGSQWMVTGDQSGFLHHVVADANTGACRNSCDPVLARRNGRVLESKDVVNDRAADALDPSPAFMNPMFRFSIKSGGAPSERDMTYRFATTGSFAPMLLTLSADGTSLISPQAITYLPPTFELAVTDGSINGLIMVSLQSAGLSRTFF